MQPKIFVSKDKGDRDGKIWKRLEKLGIFKDNPDLLIFEDEKIGIAQVKQLVKHLSTKPFGETPKSAVLFNGNNISIDAQNALLKTLEEPPGESIILIGVDAENKLLPTIISRCHIINNIPLAFHLKGAKLNVEFSLDGILNSTIKEKFALIEKTEDKERFLEDLTQLYREKVFKGEGDEGFLEVLLQAQIWKESNVNIRTILEYLMLRLK